MTMGYKNLGLMPPVCAVADQQQFLPHHKLPWKAGDVDIAGPIVVQTQELFPDFGACSCDCNFHSPENRVKLDKLLEWHALPAKGKLSAARREWEAEKSFRPARQRHSAGEAAINHLEHHGLDRVRTMGKAGLGRTVTLGGLRANRHRPGRVMPRADPEAAECSLAPEAVPGDPVLSRAKARQGQLCLIAQAAVYATDK